MKKYQVYSLLVLFPLLLLGGFTGCKKYFNPPLVFEEEVPQKAIKDRKVLLVSIDGLSGMDMHKYVPPVMKSLINTAKYTWDSFSDINTGDAATWTTMLSGNSSIKHGILGNSFEDEYDEDDPHGVNKPQKGGYITVFQRLLETGKKIKSLSITSLGGIDKELFGLSDDNGVLNSDLEVRDKAIDRIKNGSEQLTFAVVNFRELIKVGIEGGFTIDNEAYKSKLDELDGYLGELVEAVQLRKKYKEEDWLIIVTSNHAGIQNEYGGSSFEERTVPLIYHNANFKPLYLEAPLQKNSLVIKTKGNVGTPTITAANSLAYDLKNDKEYTIMFKVFNTKLPTGSSHGVILGRTTHAYSANRGWHFLVEGAGGSSSRYRCLLGVGSGNARITVPNYRTATVNVWETLAVTVYFKDGKRYGCMYVNGEPGEEVDLTGQKFEAPTANFFIGSGNVSSIGTFEGMVNNLVFVDRLLTDDEIKDFACKQSIDNSVPYWENVKGYWPLDDAGGTKLRNHITGNKDTDFIFDATKHAWLFSRSWNCFTAQEKVEEEKRNVSLSTDILPQVFYWLNVTTDKSWDLEGTLFLNGYEKEFITK